MNARSFHKEVFFLVIVPILILELFFIFYQSENSTLYWKIFQPLLNTKSNSNIIVIGSSRAATAVIPELLEKHAKSDGSINGAVFNLGMGYSTTVGAYFLLKKLSKANPNAFKNSIVLIETSNGLPPFDLWSDLWFHPAFPLMALPFMEQDDIERLIASQAISNDMKLFIIPSYYLALPKEIFISRSILYEKGAQFSEYASKVLDHTSPGLDVARAGGMRFDVISTIKKEDFFTCNEQIFNNYLNENIWQEAVIKDIIALVKKNDGQVAFFDPPLTPKESLCLLGETAKKALDQASRVYNQWSVQRIFFEQNYSYEDFADPIHLKLARANEYTQKLSFALREMQH
jgi:hypothetical protein